MNEEQKNGHTCGCGCAKKKEEQGAPQKEQHICVDDTCCGGEKKAKNTCEGCEEGCEECK